MGCMGEGGEVYREGGLGWGVLEGKANVGCMGRANSRARSYLLFSRKLYHLGNDILKRERRLCSAHLISSTVGVGGFI